MTELFSPLELNERVDAIGGLLKAATSVSLLFADRTRELVSTKQPLGLVVELVLVP